MGEECLEVHSVLQGLSSGSLDDGTVGKRVTEWNTHLNHCDTTALHGLNHLASTLECGTSGAEIEREKLAILAVCEELIDLVCHIFYLLSYFFNECFELVDVFEAWDSLKA